MNLELIKKEAESFFEWPTDKRTDVVTLTSCLLFAKHCVEKSQQWRPIEEAPKDGTTVMVFGLNYGDKKLGTHQCFARWEDGAWLETTEWNLESELTYLTHWQPLPPAPEAA